MGQKAQSLNKAAEKKADGKKADSKPIKATGEAADAKAVAAKAGEQPFVISKVERIAKNETGIAINLDDPASALVWLDAFFDQAKKQKAKKGYDQHWNKKGFIHAGPADRLPNDGAVNMMVFLGDMLTKRIGNSEYPDSEKAIDFCINFLTTRKATLEEENMKRIKAELDAFEAKKKATVA